jgi:hypothetical protein
MMTQKSTKYKNIMIATIIIMVLVVSSIGAVIYLLTYDNVTVSGSAGVDFLPGMPGTIIHTIEFSDAQTRAMTTFTFNTQNDKVGNYSVTLKNGHTYNVYISYSVFNPKPIETQFITYFTVNAAAGQTAITKNFGYPYFA